MIIPQIAENLTKSGVKDIPAHCPACGADTQIEAANEAEVLYCTNPDCPAKKIKSFALFVSRDALNVDGLSEATLEKFIGKGFIHSFADIFHLEQHADTIKEMEGFGEKSCKNLLDSIDKARQTTLPRLIYALGIAGIGVANAKVLCRYFDYDIEKIKSADVEELSEIDGVGEVLAGGIRAYFTKNKNLSALDNLLKELELEKPEENTQQQTLAGKVFVITGSLEHFANRNELKEQIEQRGGKVTGSVTGKTDYLINNDITSTSGKNKKAKELSVPIITEEEAMRML